MRACIKTLVQPFLLAVLIGALPPALASATDAPAGGGVRQEVKAAAHDLDRLKVGDDAIVHGAKALEHGEAQGGSLSADKLKDLFWRTVNFLALVVILVKFGAKPILSGLSGRQQRIREELDVLVASRDQAERTFRDLEVMLAGMEKEAELIVERAIAQAKIEKERILADAEKAAGDIKRQAETAVQAELEDAKRILLAEIAEQAAVMAEELIVKNLTPADQITITEQYLERVGAVQ